jgi:hypothetical protein
MLSNIFQETVPDTLIDISFSSTSQQQQQTFLTSAAVTSVLSGVSSAYSSGSTAAAYHTVEGYTDSELDTVQEISCLNLQPTSADLEIPLFTVPSLEDIRLVRRAQFCFSSRLCLFLLKKVNHVYRYCKIKYRYQCSRSYVT